MLIVKGVFTYHFVLGKVELYCIFWVGRHEKLKSFFEIKRMA